MKISYPEEISEYYRQREVAQNYVAQRFTEPLNSVEHEQQVNIMNKIIKKFNCQKILEFAPGPARITANLKCEDGISVDASAEMLKQAEKVMKRKGKRWRFVKADILYDNLNGKLKEKCDLVFCFRFLLHFQEKERATIYRQASGVLKAKGYFIFEAMNRDIVLPVRWLLGQKRYFVYDKLYTKKELLQELEAQGFKVIKLYPILSHFWLQAFCSRPFKVLKMNNAAKKIIWYFEAFKSSQPYEWVVLCQKK